MYILYILGTFENAPNVQNVKNALCVIKNGALIFREKGCWNGFLRTFWECLRICLQKVRGSKVIRLVGDKVILHNWMKLNWLCGLVVRMEKKNKETVFRFFRVYRVNEKCPKYPIYPKYPRYIFAEIAVCAHRNVRIEGSGTSRTSGSSRIWIT